jgi:hypothetical protein
LLDFAIKQPNILKGVILENVFLSMRAISKLLIPQLDWLVPFVISDVWRNDLAVKKLKVGNILFLQSGKDEMMP